MNKIYLTLQNIESLLLSQKTTLNVEELSKYTGLSKSYIYKLTSGSQIPHSKPTNKCIFFNKEIIDSWLMSNPINPVADVEQEAINYVTNRSSNASSKRGGVRWDQ